MYGLNLEVRSFFEHAIGSMTRLSLVNVTLWHWLTY